MGAVTEYGSEAVDSARFEKSVGEVLASVDAKAERIREAEDQTEAKLHEIEAAKEAAIAKAEAEAEEAGESKPCGRWDDPQTTVAASGVKTDAQGYGVGTNVYGGDGTTRPIGEAHSNGRHLWGLKGDGYYGWIDRNRFTEVYGAENVAAEFDIRLSATRAMGRWLCTFAEGYEAFARSLRGAGEGEKLQLTLQDLTYYGFSEDPALDKKLASISEL